MKKSNPNCLLCDEPMVILQREDRIKEGTIAYSVHACVACGFQNISDEQLADRLRKHHELREATAGK